MKIEDLNEALKQTAHQWKQPLSRINANVLALETILNELQIKDKRIENCLDEIESMTHYMASTMQSFLEIKKQQNCINIDTIINEAYALLKPSLQESEITVSLNIDKQQECLGVANDLLQVLLVLITNAKDALLERNVYPAIIEINSFTQEGLHTIEIIDNAGGMTQNAMQKIFDSHYTTKHSSEGSGIGLGLARKIIRENFHGDISVQNFRKGSCFCITIGSTI